jgi:hypothetical protein
VPASPSGKGEAEHTDTVHTSQKTHYVSAIEPSRLMLFEETVAVYYEIHTEHTDTVCGQDAQFVNQNRQAQYLATQPPVQPVPRDVTFHSHDCFRIDFRQCFLCNLTLTDRTHSCKTLAASDVKVTGSL